MQTNNSNNIETGGIITPPSAVNLVGGSVSLASDCGCGSESDGCGGGDGSDPCDED